jgi:hypothetical protein
MVAAGMRELDFVPVVADGGSGAAAWLDDNVISSGMCTRARSSAICAISTTVRRAQPRHGSGGHEATVTIAVSGLSVVIPQQAWEIKESARITRR